MKKQIKDQIYLIGHSRGGGISIIAANEDKRIKKLVTWAAIADLTNRFSSEELAIWKKKQCYLRPKYKNQSTDAYVLSDGRRHR